MHYLDLLLPLVSAGAANTLFIKLRRFLLLGIGLFLGVPSIFGVWDLTLPAFVNDPCVGIDTPAKRMNTWSINVSQSME
jgi:hypothetical protein